MAKDLVCGMQVDAKTPAATSKYLGEIFYFCSQSCKNQFEENPPKYIDSEAESSTKEPDKSNKH